MAGMAPEGWEKPWPFGGFLFGLGMFVLAVVSTFTGKTYLRGSTDRTKEPFNFWTVLIVQYLGGIFLMWAFRDSAFPN
jgi:hypothetical protein